MAQLSVRLQNLVVRKYGIILTTLLNKNIVHYKLITMDTEIKFDPKKLAKLNNPERFKTLNPDVIWEALDMQNPEVLIDIGAGTGFFANEFVKKISGGKIYACDTSEIMIKWMKENITENNMIPLLCSESSIALESEAADLVYMINVHHELLEPKKLLGEAYRLLKPNGKIAIIDWKKEEMTDGPSIEKRISEETIMEQLKNVGFNNVVSHNILLLHSFVIGQK